MEAIKPPTEPPETVDSIYREALTSEIETKLQDAYKEIGKEFMTSLCAAFLDMLHAQFSDFQQPCALESYGAPTAFKTPYMMAPLDFATTPDGANLMDFDWYNECEPLDDIPICYLFESYKLLNSLLQADK